MNETPKQWQHAIYLAILGGLAYMLMFHHDKIWRLCQAIHQQQDEIEELQRKIEQK